MNYAVYNPNNRPIEELPVIYGFNNGSCFGDCVAGVLIAADGEPLGSHACSSGEQPEPTYVGTCCVGIFLGDPCTHTFKGERCTRCGEFTDEFYEREGQKWDELAARMNCPPQDEQP